jgi:ABC-type multidrug transport system ATPase subunit
MELRISNLSKRYANGVQALDDVSLTIPAGMFGLLGPNGAGKSTLMRTIATLQEADSGSIQLDQLDVLRDKDGVRRVLGYLPQEFGVYPKVHAEELLHHFAILKGIGNTAQRKEIVNAILKKTNLWEQRYRRLGTYSGGMKQRFGIAQALLGDPRLIIVDEPTAGLDPEERLRFHNLLAEIGEQVIVILSTHIVSDVSDLCQRMAIINKGRVVESGEPLALTARLEGHLWRKFVTRDEVDAHRREHNVIRTQRFAGRVLIHVHSDGNPGAGFEPIAPDLEDVYFHTIGAAARAPDGDAPAEATA